MIPNLVRCNRESPVGVFLTLVYTHVLDDELLLQDVIDVHDLKLKAGTCRYTPL
jgi:hypothetical protein